MPKPKALPAVEVLRELLEYNPDSGNVYWRVSRGRVRAGQSAGSAFHRGYRQIRVLEANWLLHRIIWKLHTGQDPDPDLVVDHINRNTGDNRWANLRLATHAVNSANQGDRDRPLPRNVSLDKRRGNYTVMVGRPPNRWVKSCLTLEQATILAAEWRSVRYGLTSVT